MVKNYKIFSILVLVVISVAVFNFYIARNMNSIAPLTHIVVFTDIGFSPAELIINRGDTVKFINNSAKEFWPASDLHPTHGIYPEFDPRQPVKSGEAWSFTFEKVGSWRYHDHLFSSKRGVISVSEGNDLGDKDCFDEADRKCWSALINSALGKSLDEAFGVLGHLYSTQPSFASACHEYAHELGRTAYIKFSKKEEVRLTPKTAYCGFGFYHGFMESLLQDGADINKAREFCAYAGSQLIKETSDAEGACYHGIGHGVVDGSDPRAWGDPQAMIEPGIRLCETVSESDQHLYRCTTGAFNALEILSADPKFKISSLRKDPFSICKNQPYKYKEGCYTNMMPALYGSTGGDFIKIYQIIEKIPDDADYKIRSWVILGLFHEFARVNLSVPDYNMGEGVRLCRGLDKEYHLSCIEGLSGGHMKYGEPGKEYIKGLAFCAADYLSSIERDTCYKHILNRLKIWYSAEKTDDICNGVGEYKKYCPSTSG